MRGIHKSFGATTALTDVSLRVLAGEVHALVGENGAGKSTLMKILAGVHRPDSGSMLLDGEPYDPADPHDGRARGVGMIYQELSIAPHLSVAENMMLGMEPRRGPFFARSRARAIALKTLAELGHPEVDVDQPAGRLAISQQQVVEIGRSVAMGCRVIVFDEPTSSLAQEDVTRLGDLIAKLAAQGIAILYISHFLEEVRRFSSSLTVMRDGRSVGGYPTATVSDERIVADMVGRDVHDLYPRSARKPGETLLEARIPGVGAMAVRRGEILGLCGLVGSGRTRTLRAIFGLDSIEAEVLMKGRPVVPAPRAAWFAGCGFVSENRKEEGLALDLSIADNVCLPALDRPPGRLGLVQPAELARRTRTWIAELNIRCQGPGQPLGSLSGGNQQKAAIARLIDADCDVWLMDEPTRGIDIAAKARIYQLMDQLVADPARPRAIVMVSSHLPELLGVCDRVMVVRRGRLGPPHIIGQVSAEQLMFEATGAA